MLFNSLQYVVFFPIVVIAFFFLSRSRYPEWLPRVLLLAASLFFYMCWNPWYVLLMLASVAITWLSGILMERKALHKGAVLFLSLFLNLSILIAFKYYNFFAESVFSLSTILGIPWKPSSLNVLLPVGISFYTFQALGYSIDVYRGTVPAERNFITYALFVTFFPQLVAGPIERTANLLPQFKTRRSFDYDNAADGLKLMAWGMFKKVVIADRLSPLVNTVYNSPASFSGAAFAVATVFFAFQIFCDFSGYSDIAIGSARVMGFRLMRNFDRPYFSRSIQEFWKRWHISLSSWFKDYLYIPLGGNRAATARVMLNLFITFTVSGLWHGANWTFLIWGSLNGCYLIASSLTKDWRRSIVKAVRLDRLPRVHAVLQVAVTFALTCLAWIFFRANDIGDAVYILGHLHTGWGQLLHMDGLRLFVHGFGLENKDLELATLLIVFMEAIHLIQGRWNIIEGLKTKPAVVRWTLYYGLLGAILWFGVFSMNDFIYFQF